MDLYIKDAAKLLQTTTRAIRFYEEKGLIYPQKAVDNNYRFFTDQDLLRLHTILALREIGIPVQEIKQLLSEEGMNTRKYLDIQRAALFEKWLEIRDMLGTIDGMVGRTEYSDFSMKDIHKLAQHLKNLKEQRKGWVDKWDFDSWADNFDSHIKQEGHGFNVHQGYDEALAKVVQLVERKENALVVDIGVGTGNLGAKFLQNEGSRVIGVDQSDEMLLECKRAHPEIDTRKGHFLALPLLDEQADAIVSSYALHHLPDKEKLLALEEMTRVLKAGGQICIADLMFVDKSHRKEVMDELQAAGNTEAIAAIEDEYYADCSVLIDWLLGHGYSVDSWQLNDILGIIYAKTEGERY
ncbi:MerR family transcriptional regulator [Lentibacillus sediminis]|uniref:MerR family transcriptional regulator n=1 Tax=Lentibacillus sediminis TaxID=1940529 RepID=UPI000C1C61AB|nr:MerR family transcriptional regulator [Lentibacillus sediminis]